MAHGGDDLIIKIGGDTADFKKSLEGLTKQVLDWVKDINPEIAGVVGLIAGIGIAAFEAGETFETAFNTIIAKTGATGRELEGLKASFTDVFTEVPIKAEDAAEAVGLLHTRLGLIGEDLTHITEEMGKFALLSGANPAQFADSATQAFQAWHVANDDLNSSLDYFNTVAQTYDVNAQKLIGDTGQLEPIAKLLGLTMENTANLSGLFASKNLDVAGTLQFLQRQMVTFVKEGADPTTVSADSIIQHFQELIQTTDGYAQALTEVGPRHAKFLEVLKDTPDILDKIHTSLAGTKDSIDDTYQKTESLSRSWQELKNNLTALLSGPGMYIVQFFNGVVQVILDATKAVKDLVAITGIYISMIPGYDAAKKFFSTSEQGWDMTTNSTRLSTEKLKEYEEAFKGLNDTDTAGIWPSLTSQVQAHAAALKQAASDNAFNTHQLVEEYNRLVEVHKKELDQSDPLAKFYDETNEWAKKLKASFDSLKLSIQDVATSEANWQEKNGNLNSTIAGITASLQNQGLMTDSVYASYDRMGIKSADALQDLADQADIDFQRIYDSGTATSHDLMVAELKDLQAMKDAAIANDTAITDADQKRLTTLEAALSTSHKHQKTAWEELQQMSNKAINDLSKGLAEVIVSGGKFSDVLKKVAKDFVTTFIDIGIKAVLKFTVDAITNGLGKALSGVLDSIHSIGAGLSKIFSSGASSASSAAGASGSGASGAAGSIASAGVGGIINVVSGVVSAVSSVIGNFQMAHLNNTVNAMEQETARMAIYLGDQQGNSIQYYTGRTAEYIVYVLHRLESILTLLGSGKLSLAGASSGGGSSDLGAINFNTFWSLKKLDEIDFNTYWALQKFDKWHTSIMGIPGQLDGILKAITPVTNVSVTLDGKAIAKSVSTTIEQQAQLQSRGRRA